jgi:hypothetical protein
LTGGVLPFPNNPSAFWRKVFAFKVLLASIGAIVELSHSHSEAVKKKVSV